MGAGVGRARIAGCDSPTSSADRVAKLGRSIFLNPSCPPTPPGAEHVTKPEPVRALSGPTTRPTKGVDILCPPKEANLAISSPQHAAKRSTARGQMAYRREPAPPLVRFSMLTGRAIDLPAVPSPGRRAFEGVPVASDPAEGWITGLE